MFGPHMFGEPYATIAALQTDLPADSDSFTIAGTNMDLKPLTWPRSTVRASASATIRRAGPAVRDFEPEMRFTDRRPLFAGAYGVILLNR